MFAPKWRCYGERLDVAIHSSLRDEEHEILPVIQGACVLSRSKPVTSRKAVYRVDIESRPHGASSRTSTTQSKGRGQAIETSRMSVRVFNSINDSQTMFGDHRTTYAVKRIQ